MLVDDDEEEEHQGQQHPTALPLNAEPWLAVYSMH